MWRSKSLRASSGRGNLIEGGLLMVVGYLEESRGRLVIAFWWKWNIEMHAATLLPIIQHHVRPSSIVYSDEWSSYRSLNAVRPGLVHDTVNHSVHFVDPASGAHTQGVKGCGAVVKEC